MIHVIQSEFFLGNVQVLRLCSLHGQIQSADCTKTVLKPSRLLELATHSMRLFYSIIFYSI